MGFRLADREGRAVLLLGEAGADGVTDLERASGGAFSSDPMAALARPGELAELGSSLTPADADGPLDLDRLGPCVPRPAKVFAVGLNYRSHAEESGMALPTSPMVFTKFPSCLVGPTADVVLPSPFVDWEVELVAVIGRGGRHIPAAAALDHIAGYTVGQDLSDRVVQFADNPAQFNLGKSYDTFGPLGPAVVSPDLLGDPGDLHLWCDVDGERMQDGRTSDLVFPVPTLIEFLSGICTLAPGDVIFTGTPAGVGVGRSPARFLAPGELVTSGIDGLGTLANRCVAA